MEKLIDELHKPARKNFKRRHFVMKTIYDTYQMDLADMSAYKKENRNHTFILIIIDIFSKFVIAKPLKSKSAQHVTEAMEKVLKEYPKAKNYQVDQGREFWNSSFQNLMKKHKLNLYHTFSTMKCSICERVILTLKRKIYKRFSLQLNHNWIDCLQEIVDIYNKTKHRTIKMKPVDITPENAKAVYRRVYSPFRTVESQAKNMKFKVNDKVRISKYKYLFDKSYFPTFTNEIFTVTKIKNTNPPTYLLKDFQGKDIHGGFYNEELSAVSDPDLYLVEKIIRRKGAKVFVKWLGFSNEYNSWIDKKDLL